MVYLQKLQYLPWVSYSDPAVIRARELFTNLFFLNKTWLRVETQCLSSSLKFFLIKQLNTPTKPSFGIESLLRVKIFLPESGGRNAFELFESGVEGDLIVKTTVVSNADDFFLAVIPIA